MKKYAKHFFFYIIATVIITSCNKDALEVNENNISDNPFEIKSSEKLEIISLYDNGWIKEAILFQAHKRIEFEYHPNGYLKYYKISYPALDEFTYLEASRNEKNEGLWSKYYYPDGSLWFETEYLNGVQKQKKVFTEDNHVIHNYDEGTLISSELYSKNDQLITRTTFDNLNRLKKTTVFKDGEIIFEQETSTLEDFGEGFNSWTFMSLANPYDSTLNPTRRVKSSFGSYFSSNWISSELPVNSLYPNKIFDYAEIHTNNESWAKQNPLNLQYAITDNLYQSVLEQYPFLENQQHLYQSFIMVDYYLLYQALPWENSEVKDKNLDSLTIMKRYGTDYLFKKHYGFEYSTFGVFRNLPTNPDLRDEIFTIARKKFSHITTGSEDITMEEKEILDNIWFEVKHFYKGMPSNSGVILESYEQKDELTQNNLDQEPILLQKKYRSHNPYLSQMN